MTSDRALALARERRATDISKLVEKDRRTAQTTINAARREYKLRDEENRLQESAWLCRGMAIGVRFVQLKRTVRSLEEKRAIARHRVAVKRQDALEKHRGIVDISIMMTWRQNLFQQLIFNE